MLPDGIYSKRITLAQMAESDEWKDGFKTGLCHGCFDLFHYGHLLHLQMASTMCENLVVSITSDRFVNKGPGRPIHTAEQRAQMLECLDFVNYVVIVDAPDALPAIEAAKPQVYFKGAEYRGEDITGKMALEQAAVEAYGGKVVFTTGETESSSRLINEFMPQFDEETTAFLAKLKQSGAQAKIDEYLARIKSLDVLIVGEAIEDRYIYVSSLGKSAKENIIATQFESKESFSGGIDATAKHIEGLCDTVDVCSEVTLRKTRYIEMPYARKLFEVYDHEMDDGQLSAAQAYTLAARLTEFSPNYDLVIVCDYGHGMIGPEVVEALQDCAKFLAVNVQTNAGNLGYNLLTKYKRADFLCVDAMEARLAAQDKHGPLEKITDNKLPQLITCPLIVVTHGSAGCYIHKRGPYAITHAPAFRQTVVDTMGAGDAFFAVASLFAYCGASPEIVGLVGNVAGAMKVGTVGHREPTDPVKFKRYVQTLLK